MDSVGSLIASPRALWTQHVKILVINHYQVLITQTDRMKGVGTRVALYRLTITPTGNKRRLTRR